MVQHFAKTCCVHFIRNIDKLPNNIPRDVTNKLKSFIGLKTNEDIAEWHRYCKSSPYKEVVNWYNQKIEHPWYLPSLNSFLSPIPHEDWITTPNDSNLGEGAHAARNAETAINRPLLAGILDARKRDKEVADRLAAFEKSFTAASKSNLPYDREKRAMARRNTKFRQTEITEHARAEYQTLEERMDEITAKHLESMDKTHQIDARLKAIAEELKGCSKISMKAKDLGDERSQLKQESRKLIDRRKEWAAEKVRIKERMKEIKDHELKNVRAHDRRPATSSRPSSPVNRSSSPAFPPPTSPVNPSSDDYPQVASPLPVEMMEENLGDLPPAVDGNPAPNQGWEEGHASGFTVRNDPMFENLSWVDFPTMTDEDWWKANEDLLENLANNHADYTATYNW